MNYNGFCMWMDLMQEGRRQDIGFMGEWTAQLPRSKAKLMELAIKNITGESVQEILKDESSKVKLINVHSLYWWIQTLEREYPEAIQQQIIEAHEEDDAALAGEVAALSPEAAVDRYGAQFIEALRWYFMANTI